MPAVFTRPGAPLPYRLECRGNPPLQYAVVTCCECETEDKFVFRSQENPTLIVQKFQRRGWEFYKSSKARCPECKHKNNRRKAFHAKKDEENTMPTPTPPISLVKTPKPEEEAPSLARRQTWLLILEGGVLTTKPLTGAKEMLFGNQAYLVIPLDEDKE